MALSLVCDWILFIITPSSILPALPSRPHSKSSSGWSVRWNADINNLVYWVRKKMRNEDNNWMETVRMGKVVLGNNQCLFGEIILVILRDGSPLRLGNTSPMRVTF